MSEVAAALESRDEFGHGVRVEFTKVGDRFQHTIFALDGEHAYEVFSSVEGSAEEGNPLSPPFQELHQQDQTVFLTGATTNGHWSMSISEIVLTEHELSSRLFDKRYGLNEPTKHPKNRSYIAFEAACRLKAANELIGSSYQGVRDGEFTCAPDDIMAMSTSPPLFLGSIALSGQRECYVRPLDGDLVDATRFQIRPPGPPPESFPHTLQWRYGVFWL